MKMPFLLVVAALGLTAAMICLAQTAPTKEHLPPSPDGQQWKLLWHDEFDSTTLDQTKWNRLGEHKRKDGWANASG